MNRPSIIINDPDECPFCRLEGCAAECADADPEDPMTIAEAGITVAALIAAGYPGGAEALLADACGNCQRIIDGISVSVEDLPSTPPTELPS